MPMRGGGRGGFRGPLGRADFGKRTFCIVVYLRIA